MGLLLVLGLTTISIGQNSEAAVRTSGSVVCQLSSATINADGSYNVKYLVSGLKSNQQAFLALVEPVTLIGGNGYEAFVPQAATSSTIQEILIQNHVAAGSYSPWVNVSNSKWFSVGQYTCGPVLNLP